MNLSAQLRIILLLVGGALMLLIYLLGRRQGRKQARSEYAAQSSPAFPPAVELDEDELDTPAYMRRNSPVHLPEPLDDVPDEVPPTTLEARSERRSAARASHSDQFNTDEPVAALHDLQPDDLPDDEDDGYAPRLGWRDDRDTRAAPVVRTAVPEATSIPMTAPTARQLTIDAVEDAAEPVLTFGAAQRQPATSLPAATAPAYATEQVLESGIRADRDADAHTDMPLAAHADAQLLFDEPIYADAAGAVEASPAVDELTTDAGTGTVSDTSGLPSSNAHDAAAPDDVSLSLQVEHHDVEEVVIAAEPVQQPLPVTRDAQPVVVIAEPPTIPSITADSPVEASPAPVLSTPTLSEVAAPRRATAKPAAVNRPAAKRKIIALRLQVASRVAGTQLLELMHKERLEHGKFNIFHRQHHDTAVFSVASMVEPGSFDLALMPDQQFPGITFFMLLPGPLDGLIAWDQMLSCAQRMAHATNGVLQDERGTRLTAALIERLREDVLNFQHLLGDQPADV